MSTAAPLAETAPLSGETTMGELLQLYPGAQRALFAKYHIGGCQSCGFSPGETVAQLCARNENIPVAEFLEHVHASHNADSKIQISPQEFAALREAIAADGGQIVAEAAARCRVVLQGVERDFAGRG